MRSGGTLRFKMARTSGIDWFDLQAHLEFPGEGGGVQTLPVAAAIAAREAGQPVLELPDGTLGLLDAQWEKRLAALEKLTGHQDGGYRLRGAQVLMLDALLEEDATRRLLQGHRELLEARERLKRFTSLTPAIPPAAFQGRLRPYQQDGLAMLQFWRELGLGGCLADDMGLGKTVQVLAHLAGLHQVGEGGSSEQPAAHPSLIVAPKTLLFNWEAEIKRFAPHLRVLLLHGPERPRGAQLLAAVRNADLVLTTYHTLARDIAELREILFKACILDEAQAIKNPGAAASKAARLLQAEARLALTGTPVENHLGDLVSLFEFLSPGLLGKIGREAKGTNAEVGRLLGSLLRPFLLRRTKAKVLHDLPPKVEQVEWVEMDDAQRDFYQALRDTYRRDLLGMDEGALAKNKIMVLEALLRLRQAASDPALVDPTKDLGSAKLDQIVERLEELQEEGHQVLVFSQFTTLLDRLAQRLEVAKVRHLQLDGRTRDRQAVVQAFQGGPTAPPNSTPETSTVPTALLVSLKAGGVGLNLTAASYVFFLDPWWNPAAEAQAMDRAHRMGQKRSVLVTRLITKDTVEERVLELQDRKRALVEAVLGGENENPSLIASLTREDLERLLA